MLKKQYLKTRPICKVTFTLPREAAPNAGEVKVLGDFNNWSWENGTPMKAGKNEYKATIELETGKSYEFRYMVDGHHWENDFQADAYVPNEFGGDNSVVVLEKSPARKEKATTTPARKKSAPPAKKKAAAPAKKKAAPPAKKKAATPAKKKATKPARKKTAKKADTPAADDLKKIEGIGPKIEKLFHEAGITSYKALSTARKAQLKEVLGAAGPRYRMHDPASWTQQAKLAAKGEWDKLAKLQDELKGGKKK